MGRKAEGRRARARKEQAQATRTAMRWIGRRLDLLEYLALFLALLLSLGGGALVAWVLGATAGLPFRPTWTVAALLLFIVPGGTVYLRELRRGNRGVKPGGKSQPKDPNG